MRTHRGKRANKNLCANGLRHVQQRLAHISARVEVGAVCNGSQRVDDLRKEGGEWIGTHESWAAICCIKFLLQGRIRSSNSKMLCVGGKDSSRGGDVCVCIHMYVCMCLCKCVHMYVYAHAFMCTKARWKHQVFCSIPLYLLILRQGLSRAWN